ncbi:MAG: hypothetical protein LBF77_01675, partial [Spirochaetaceae bacterium]|nr:hypothetical protein [Spirochaetaceae bacterium]
KDHAGHKVPAPAGPDSKTIHHAVKDFIVYAETLLTLVKEAKKPAKAAPDTKTAGKQDAVTVKFLHVLAEAVSARPVIAVFGLGYGLLRLLRAVPGKGADGGDAKALAEHWSLDRKLREAFEGIGVPGDEAWRITEIMKAVLARTGAAGKAAFSREITAQSLTLENYDAADFRSILKVNSFENTTWFNKEAFEEALFYVPLFALLEYGQARAETIALAAEQFHKAGTASEYKLGRLIDLLAPKTPSARTKKTAGITAGSGKANTGTAKAGTKKEAAKPKGRNEKNRK